MTTNEFISTLRQARDLNLDLFAEYICLATDAQQKGDNEAYHRWLDRAMAISKVYRNMADDIHAVLNGVERA